MKNISRTITIPFNVYIRIEEVYSYVNLTPNSLFFSPKSFLQDTIIITFKHV